jgi:hypothetical protein
VGKKVEEEGKEGKEEEKVSEVPDKWVEDMV